MKKVQVLGSGCKKCKTLAKEVQKAADNLGMEIDLEKVEDFAEIMKFNVMSTPALVVDGNVLFSGQVKKAKDLEAYLTGESA
ncbi:MAG: thioredoxin family protein [Fibrobacterota bacterium]